MTSANQIAIMTDDPGWHGRELVDAFARHGYEASFVSLTACHLVLENGRSHVHIPGISLKSLAGVFVRGVPGGSLPQVILRLNVLHSLADMGFAVYNSGRAIERTVDKAMTSFLLTEAGLPTPDTLITESYAVAREHVVNEASAENPLIMKPVFGSQGIGVKKVFEEADLHIDPDLAYLFGEVYYLQRFIRPPASQQSPAVQSYDWRVLVINGRAEAMMLRTSDHWITNRAQGARCQAIDFDEQLASLAEQACQVLDIDYAGVDLMQDENGQFLITEVNSIPAWWGLQKVVGFKIADRLVDHCVAKIHQAERTQHLALLP